MQRLLGLASLGVAGDSPAVSFRISCRRLATSAAVCGRSAGAFARSRWINSASGSGTSDSAGSSSASSGMSADAGTYVVQPGDTLSDIAVRKENLQPVPGYLMVMRLGKNKSWPQLGQG